MTDIVTRLRQTRADMIGTDDEQHYWDVHDAAAEIERLRLTDAEREAVEASIHGENDATVIATLRGLLDRLSPIKQPDFDRPQPISDARLTAQQRTPQAQPTPDECSTPRWCTSHRPPTLTDSEREALGKACDLADYAGFHSTTRAVLRGLLKRLSPPAT